MPLELKNISFTYSPHTPFRHTALKDISLLIENGEFIGIMGQTGCGKSTLIQIMAGLLQPQTGEVLLDGKNINGDSFSKKDLYEKIGIVFQYPEQQLFESTVKKDIAFGLKNSPISHAEKEAKIQDALQKMRLDYDKIAELSPLALSGGEKRRVAIAGILVKNTDFLILDEPTAGLDGKTRAEFLQMLQELNQNGTTIIMVSHDTDALAEYSQRIVLLENGTLAADTDTKNAFLQHDLLQRLQINDCGIQRIIAALKEKNIVLKEDNIAYAPFLEDLLIYLKKDASEKNFLTSGFDSDFPPHNYASKRRQEE